jgi:hypothetical protein
MQSVYSLTAIGARNVGVCNRVCSEVGKLLVVVFPTPHVSWRSVFLDAEGIVMPDGGAQRFDYASQVSTDMSMSVSYEGSLTMIVVVPCFDVPPTFRIPASD